jgi:YlmC/YmxH family sporulation protein
MPPEPFGGGKMQCRIADLRCKEVINVCDGNRLGFVDDVLVELPAGQVCAIVVQGEGKCFGLLGHDEDYIIPWECIVKMGEDVILAEVKTDHRRGRR